MLAHPGADGDGGLRVPWVIPDAWYTEARLAARRRRDFHAARGSARHWTDPQKGELDDEVAGSLGQIAVRQVLLRWGLTVTVAPLFTEALDRLPAWDLAVGEVTIEVKTVPPDEGEKQRTRLLVKVAEYHPETAVYVAVHLPTWEHCTVRGWATGVEVAQWPVRNRGFAPAYEHPLVALRPLAMLRELLAHRYAAGIRGGA